MKKEGTKNVPEMVLPEFELSASATRIRKGESTTVQWNVQRAEEATFWTSTVLPEAPEPLDWQRISMLGQKVALSDKVELTPEETTACYIVAKGGFGLRGIRIVIEVIPEELAPTRKPETWEPQKRYLARMTDTSHVGWIDLPAKLNHPEFATGFEFVMKLAETWYAGTPPNISMSVSQKVMFSDETSTLSWTITNANSAEMGENISKTFLAVDLTSTSGTKLTGGGYGAAGMPPGGLNLNGSGTLTGQGFYTSGHRVFCITAHNIAGLSATASKWMDTLPVPQFKGSSTATRKSDIRSAIKTIDEYLRNGSIYNDTALDTSVAAFKNGHLNRKEFWARLLAELENIKLDTFNCQVTTDANWGGGHWSDYSNEIKLDWSPSYTPNLEYVILHELVHKCGFNGNLLKYYAHSDIENQAHTISGTVFP